MKQILIYVLIFLAGIIAYAEVNEDASDAASQQRVLNRYKSFLRWVRQNEESRVRNDEAIKKLKVKREAEKELQEAARKKQIDERNQRRRKITEEELDQKIEEMKDRNEEVQLMREKEFVQKRDHTRKALSKIPQVDPEDEYQVGQDYEDFADPE